MIFANHDFEKNFLRTIKSKDMKLSRELIISELGKVIQSRPFQVRKLLVGCGVSISTNAKLRELVYAVNFNMAQNTCVRVGMSKLILQNQTMLNNAWLNQGGTDPVTPPAGGSFNVNTALNTISTAAGIWFGVSEGNKNRDAMELQQAHEMQLAQMNSELMLKQMEYNSMQPAPPVQAGPGTGSKTIMWVLIALAAVGITVMVVRGRKPSKPASTN